MSRRLAIVILAGVMLATTASAAAGDGPSGSTQVRRGAFPGANGKIVFRALAGDNEIARVSPNATGLVDLTDNVLDDSSPAWNAKGNRIAWVQDGDVWIMRANGTEARQVTHTERAEYEVAWAPSGDRLAVVRDTLDYELFVIGLDGRTISRVTRTPYGEADVSWSPDGELLLYTGEDAEGTNQVFTIRPDGTRRRKLTNLSSSYAGGWHPNGRRIVFFSNAGSYQLFRMSRTGDNIVQLTFSEWDNEQPTYSPDGLSLVWTDDFDGDYEIVTAPLSNLGSPTQLTANDTHDSAPDWQPTR